MASAEPPRLSTLTNAPIDLEALREDGWNELVSILREATGSVVVVIDSSLAAVLKLIAPNGNLSRMTDHGVVEIQTLNWNFINAPHVDSVVYLVRPSFVAMRQIAAQVNHATRLQPDISIRVQFVPRRSFICEKILKDEGVFGMLTIGEYSVDLVPIDDDLLSMQQPTAFQSCFLEDDPTPLHDIARSVFKLQRMFGVIPNVHAKGEMAKAVVDMLTRFRREEGDDLSYEEPEIDTLIVLDRNVDFVTPLVTPLTYEALIDETFGIDAAAIELEDDEGAAEGGLGDDDDGAVKVTCPLNSNDKLYCEIRDLNIASVKPLLQQKARDIQALADTRHTLRDSKMAEIKKYVKRISGVTAEKRSLFRFINITEKVQRVTSSEPFFEQWQIERAILVEERTRDVFDRIDTAIGKREPLHVVLQLLCLQCQVEGGFKAKQFDHYRREVIQAYGFEHMFTMYNLEKLGLFYERVSSAWSSASWGAIRASLALIEDDPRLDDPDSMAYVTSGYAPLSIRLIEKCLSVGWPRLEDTMKLLPGPTVQVLQTPLAASTSEESKAGPAPPAGAGEADGSQRRKVVLVFFIGGVTYVELAALRFLTDKSPFDFVVATTDVVNGKTLVTSMQDSLVDDAEAAGTAYDSDGSDEHKD